MIRLRAIAIIKRTSILSLILFFSTFIESAQPDNEDRLTITTYYPSPYGVYSDLSVKNASSTGNISDSGTGVVDLEDLQQGELFVEDSVIFKPQPSDPPIAEAKTGELIYRGTVNVFKHFDGNEWVQMAGRSGCYVAYGYTDPMGGTRYIFSGTPCREDLGFKQVGVGSSYGYCEHEGGLYPVYFRPPGSFCSGNQDEETRGAAYLCCK